jgi:hypothetical protein
MGENGGNVQVVCRFRPQNAIEDAKGGGGVVTFEDEQTVTVNHSVGVFVSCHFF